MEVRINFHGTQFPNAKKIKELPPGRHVVVAFEEYSWPLRRGVGRGTRPRTLKRRFALYIVILSACGSVSRDMISRHATLEGALKAGSRIT
jgi:hypothetical protein